MKKFMCIAAMMLMGMCQNLFAQTSESDYSLKGLSLTLKKIQVMDLGDFQEGLAKILVNKGERNYWGMINKKGEILIPCDYSSISKVSDGLISVKNENGFGYIDKNGNVVIECQYYAANDFSEGLAAVQTKEDNKNDSWRFIDTKGKTVIPPIEQVERVGDFHNGVAPIGKKDKISKTETTYLIDTKGNVTSSPQAVRCFGFSGGLFLVRNQAKGQPKRYGMMNKDGKMVIPTEYQNKLSFSDGLAVAENDDRLYGFIDTAGNIKIAFQFEAAANFENGLALIMKNGKCGFINKSGDIVVPCQFDKAYNFSDGYAAVCQEGKWGYIELNGKIIIPCQYERVYSFYDGLAVIRIGEKYGFIDKKGNSTFDYK